jgi:carboxymethylenebutenolidase
MLASLILVVAALSPGLAIAGEMITFPKGSGTNGGYLAVPKGEGTHPGVIVVHEWWGISDWNKGQTDSLAALGYVALAVDLYGGKLAKDNDEAHQLMSGLVEEDAVASLRAGADYLRSRKDVRAQAIGTIGWCMGGRYAIRLAAADPGIRACVMYYGAPITDAAKIKGIQAAVLGNFGGEDQGPTPDQVKTFETALRKADKRVDFKIYPGASHAFANTTNPFGTYKPDAAKDAWERTKTFFDKELKKASVPKGK